MNRRIGTGYSRKKGKAWPFSWALAGAALLFLAYSSLQTSANWLSVNLNWGPSAGPLFSCLPPLGGITLSILLVMKWKSLGWREGLRFMGIQTPTLSQVLLGLLLSAPVMAGYFLSLRNYLERGVSVSLFPTWPALLVLFTVGAGFYEELAFRGFLFQYLRVGRPFFPAAALSSVLWCLSHWGNAFLEARVRVFFPEMVIFFLGLAGAYVFERSGNAVWSWMIVHLAVDFIGLFNIGNTGFFRAPVGPSMRYLFGGEALCILLAFPLARWFWPSPLIAVTKRDKRG